MALGSTLLGDAYVNIMGETASLERSLIQARVLVGSFVNNAGKAIAVGIGSSLAAAGGAIAYATKKYAEEEAINKKLALSINMVGGSVDKLVPQYSELADKIERITKLEASQVKVAMASALARGLSAEKMQKAVPAAIGLAARLGMDLNTAMNMVTRAGMGNIMMLQRYFPQLKNATTATEKWAMVLKLGAAGIPMARGEIDTISGAFLQMRKAVGGVVTSFGGGLVRTGAFKSALQGLVDKVWDLKDALDSMVESGKFQTWVDTVVGGLAYMRNDLISTGKIMWLSLIEPIARPLGWAIDRLAEVANVAFESGNLIAKAIGGAFEYVGKILGSFGNAVATTVWEPMKWAGNNIKTLFDNIVDNVKEMMKSLVEFVKNPFAGWDAPQLSNIFEGTTGFDNVTNLIDESWKTLVADINNAAPFDAAIAQLETLKAALQTLGQGATVNPFQGWIDSFSAEQERFQKENDRIAASLGKGKGKDKKIPPGAPIKDEEEKRPFETVGFAAWYQKMQEAAKMTEAEKAQIKAQQGIEKNTRELVNYFKGEKGQPQTYLWAAMA